MMELSILGVTSFFIGSTPKTLSESTWSCNAARTEPADSAGSDLRGGSLDGLG